MLRSRSWAARRLTWTDFNQLKEGLRLGLGACIIHLQAAVYSPVHH
jgi:hypothetical protein